jgi:hypothetical protein
MGFFVLEMMNLFPGKNKPAEAGLFCYLQAQAEG